MEKTQWNTDLYDKKHNFVTQYGESLITLLNPRSNETILDLGCGTGSLTQQISEKALKVVGIDASINMITEAQKNYPNIEFKVADGHDFAFAEKFDAIFSNAALHWMDEPAKVIKCMWEALKPGGRLIFEMGGKGNIETIERAMEYAAQSLGLAKHKRLNYFPSIAEYGTLLEKQGFTIHFATLYERPTKLEGESGLANWIRMFRNSVIAELGAEKQEAFIKLAEEFARPLIYRENTWFADYVRLRMEVRKPLKI